MGVSKRFNPDLIVVDIMLPGLDGIELLTQLRRQSDVYVIMLTAEIVETDIIIGLSVGADDYLTKPCSPRELVPPLLVEPMFSAACTECPHAIAVVDWLK